MVHCEDDDLLLQVFELLERDVEEIAGTAGWVEHLDAVEACEELVQERSGLTVSFSQRSGGRLAFWRRLAGMLLACGEKILDDLAVLVPFTAQWLHDDRLDERLDILAACVVSAKL